MSQNDPIMKEWESAWRVFYSVSPQSEISIYRLADLFIKLDRIIERLTDSKSPVQNILSHY